MPVSVPRSVIPAVMYALPMSVPVRRRSAGPVRVARLAGARSITVIRPIARSVTRTSARSIARTITRLITGTITRSFTGAIAIAGSARSIRATGPIAVVWFSGSGLPGFRSAPARSTGTGFAWPWFFRTGFASTGFTAPGIAGSWLARSGLAGIWIWFSLSGFSGARSAGSRDRLRSTADLAAAPGPRSEKPPPNPPSRRQPVRRRWLRREIRRCRRRLRRRDCPHRPRHLQVDRRRRVRPRSNQSRRNQRGRQPQRQRAKRDTWCVFPVRTMCLSHVRTSAKDRAHFVGSGGLRTTLTSIGGSFCLPTTRFVDCQV